jgi:ligand-binding sensor domain-containing protein/signal transduction histidine kinase
VAALPSRALNPALDLRQYNCRSWTIQNGLPVNSVHAIAQDSQGFLELGTALGLVRFDGLAFTVLGTPPDPRLRTTLVQCLCPGAEGGMWFGLDRSAFGHRTRAGIWTSGLELGGGLDWNVPSILDASADGLWFGGSVPSRLRPGHPRVERIEALQNANVSCLYRDDRQRLWIGTTTQGLYCYEKGKVVPIQEPLFASRIIRAIAQDKDGVLWVGTHTGPICLDRQLRRVEIPFPENEIRCLLKDRLGILWVGTTGGGLIQFKNGQLLSISKADGLTSSTILCLGEDQEGSLWIGTDEGLNQLTDVKFPTLSRAQGVPTDSVLSATLSPRGGLWLGSEDGAIYLDSGQATLYSTNNAGLARPFIKRAFESRSGEVYLVSGSHSIEVMKNGYISARLPTPDMPVAFTEDAQSIIVSCGPSLYRILGCKLVPYPFKTGQAPPLYWVLNLCTSRDGSLWVACANGACHIKDGEVEQWAPKADEDLYVRYLWEDGDGSLWLALGTGIARIKNHRLERIGREQGLLEPNVNALVADDHGWLWLDTYRGISRLNKHSVEDCLAGRTNRVTCQILNDPSDVLPAEKFGYKQEMSAAKARDGRIYFPGSKGIVVIDPAHVPVNPIVPPVHVYQVSDNGRTLDSSRQIELQPGRHQLEFRFCALSLVAPQKVRFRYRLDGLDTGWCDIGNNGHASYANLPPGDYAFRVSGCNQDELWNQDGDAVFLRLKPHFYQTIWLRLLLAGATATVLLLAFKWRVRHLTRRQLALQAARDLLEQRVAERTCELETQKRQLESEVEERKRMQMELQHIHEQLMTVSREAGQAEVATSVLHNVGNVLNSVNVSVSVLQDHLARIKIPSLAKLAELLRAHETDLPRYLCEDEQGRRIPGYIAQLAEQLGQQQHIVQDELKELSQNVDHIKQVVAMQQSYSKVSGILEKCNLAEILNATLKMHAAAFQRHAIKTLPEYEAQPTVLVDKHKLLQIVINLLQNAKRACVESGRPDKAIHLGLRQPSPDSVAIIVRDNGIGIPSENLTRIFAYGFTTRKNGNGFGLHSSALAAKEMGGSLTAESPGPAHGATFTLTLPSQPSSS